MNLLWPLLHGQQRVRVAKLKTVRSHLHIVRSTVTKMLERNNVTSVLRLSVRYIHRGVVVVQCK